MHIINAAGMIYPLEALKDRDHLFESQVPHHLRPTDRLEAFEYVAVLGVIARTDPRTFATIFADAHEKALAEGETLAITSSAYSRLLLDELSREPKERAVPLFLHTPTWIVSKEGLDLFFIANEGGPLSRELTASILREDYHIAMDLSLKKRSNTDLSLSPEERALILDPALGSQAAQALSHIMVAQTLHSTTPEEPYFYYHSGDDDTVVLLDGDDLPLFRIDPVGTNASPQATRALLGGLRSVSAYERLLPALIGRIAALEAYIDEQRFGDGRALLSTPLQAGRVPTHLHTDAPREAAPYLETVERALSTFSYASPPASPSLGEPVEAGVLSREDVSRIMVQAATLHQRETPQLAPAPPSFAKDHSR